MLKKTLVSEFVLVFGTWVTLSSISRCFANVIYL